MEQQIPVVVVTGPVGVGKSRVGQACSQLLGEQDMPHAFVDMDHLRWCNRAPADDPFNVGLGLRNLALVWANYRAAGAERLIVADVVERQADIDGYRASVAGAYVTVVRLRADVPTLHARLAGRETGSSLAWHQERAVVLAAQMERDQLEDVVLDTDATDAESLAATILARVGWL